MRRVSFPYNLSSPSHCFHSNKQTIHTYTAVQPTCSYKGSVLINAHHTRGLWLVSPAAHCFYLLTIADSMTGGCLSRGSWFSSTPRTLLMSWERKALFSSYTTHHRDSVLPARGIQIMDLGHVIHYIARVYVTSFSVHVRVTAFMLVLDAITSTKL